MVVYSHAEGGYESYLKDPEFNAKIINYTEDDCILKLVTCQLKVSLLHG